MGELMKIYMLAGMALAVLAGCTNIDAPQENPANEKARCGSKTLTLQTLGTGGPIADDHRAGSGNIIWVDGKARLLVDAGSGLFVRYGEAQIDFNDHQAILLTHLHGDHVSGLPALLNSGAFAKRRDDLVIAGPTGGGSFPSTQDFLGALIGEDDGALRYLSPYLSDNDALPRLQTANIDTGKSGLQMVFDENGLTAEAIAVAHLDVPALAYVIRNKGKMIVFAGDQSFLSEDFIQALAGSKPDLLVMHNAITMADGQPRGLHRDPQSIGETAAALEAKTLVLTHHMQRALKADTDVRAAIAAQYDGVVAFADDLDCFPISAE